MDFGIWGPPQNGGNNESGQQGNNNTGENQNTTAGGTDGNNLSNNGQPPPPTPPTTARQFSHQLEHPGVVCDNCDCAIAGFRYKCLTCPDYDLCQVCERSGIHAGHVMLRIPFAELANEAIQRYFDVSNPRRPYPPPPLVPAFAGHHSRHHSRHARHGRGPTTVEPGAGGCTGTDEDGGAPFPLNFGCPYVGGKKEIKKWAKCMKKAAHQHKRSAESYMRGAPGYENQQQTSGTDANANESQSQQAATAPVPPFDFTAAAQQIQGFLNAMGLPIDVVELYDNLGNRGQLNGANANETSTRESQTQPQQNVFTSTSTSTTQDQPQPNVFTSTSTSTSTTTSTSTSTNVEKTNENETLTNQIKNLNIVESTNAGASAGAGEQALSPPTAFGNSNNQESCIQMDVNDSDWTLLDPSTPPNEPQQRNQSTAADDFMITRETFGRSGSGEPIDEPIVIPIRVENQTVPTPVSTPSNASSNNASINIPSAPAAATATANGRGHGIYPQLPTPPTQLPIPTPQQIQNVMSGFANAIRTGLGGQQQQQPIIPLPAPVTTPSGDTQRQHRIIGPQGEIVLNDRMNMTLSQLLAMGFSNNDGFLARLVHSKDGDLNTVLNQLFPQ